MQDQIEPSVLIVTAMYIIIVAGYVAILASFIYMTYSLIDAATETIERYRRFIAAASPLLCIAPLIVFRAGWLLYLSFVVTHYFVLSFLLFVAGFLLFLIFSNIIEESRDDDLACAIVSLIISSMACLLICIQYLATNWKQSMTILSLLLGIAAAIIVRGFPKISIKDDTKQTSKGDTKQTSSKRIGYR
jgi:hypothetical protein